MRFISIFSGIEAASVAWHPLGWSCVATSEIDPFACAVLKERWPEVPNLGDVTKITEQQIKELGHINVCVFGFPCTDLSVAGLRKGLKNEDGTNTRSGLFFDAARIADWTEARWVVAENVPGLLSSHGGRDFASVVGELAGCEIRVPQDGWRNAGVALGPKGLVEWATLDAQYFNLAQRRERVFIVRDSGDWANRQPLLLEPARLSGNTPPRRASRESVAPTLAARTKGGGGLGTDAECGGALIAAPVRAASPASRNGGSYPTEGHFVTEQGVAATLRSGSSNEASHGKPSGLDENLIPEPIPINMQAAAKNGLKSPNMVGIGNAGDPAYTVCASDRHAVAVAMRGREGCEGGGKGPLLSNDKSLTLGTSNDQTIFVPEICATITKNYATHHGRTAGNNGGVAEGQLVPEVAGAIVSRNSKGAGNSNSMENGHVIPEAIAFSQHQDGAVRQGDIAPTLSTNENASGRGNAKVMTQMRVRRLLPEEAEKLQGFPVGYTKIPYRGKPADKCPDSGRYKTLGNSFPVNVVRWIGERIIAVSK